MVTINILHFPYSVTYNQPFPLTISAQRWKHKLHQTANKFPTHANYSNVAQYMTYEEAEDILIRRGYQQHIDGTESLVFLQALVADTTPSHTLRPQAVLMTKWKTAFYAAEHDKKRIRLSLNELLYHHWYVADWAFPICPLHPHY